MHTSPILVTAAAGGSQGATGRHLVGDLLARGFKVRAFVRRLDDRSARLERTGAEVASGDLLDLTSVRKAFAGVKRAYFAYPVQAGLLDATAIFAEAAAEAGAEVVVNVDHLNTAPDAPSPHTRRHWLSERILDRAGIGATHLRSGVFFSNLRAVAADAVAGRGLLFAAYSFMTGKRGLFLPSGDGARPVPFVAGEDVARVAAAVLADPAAHGGRVHYVCGPLVTPREAAAAFAQVIGRPVEYRRISNERFRAALARKLPDNPVAVEHLSYLWGETLSDASRAGLARVAAEVGSMDNLGDTIRKLTGKEPKSLLDDLRERAEEFGGVSPPGYMPAEPGAAADGGGM